MGRYLCAKGKKVTIGKAGRVCLLTRCPELQVQFKKGKFKQVIPVGMTDYKGC